MCQLLSCLFVVFFALNGLAQPSGTESNNFGKETPTSIIILGTIQDGGSPHIGCIKECCKNLWDHPDQNRQVVSLGLYDGQNNKRYLFEATPDMTRQMKALKSYGASTDQEIADGIFLTHAHTGHYTGLMYLGKEAVSANEVPVYAMPRMAEYLKTNGPWSQLVQNQNIKLRPIENEMSISLSTQIAVTPVLVPHRDEYSETVGYVIQGPNQSALFIPDIDKWEKWDKDIVAEIKKVDYAFLDATFFSGKEINNRDIRQIPHPFIIESMEKFKGLDAAEKQKIFFIHFNHTNPVIDSQSEEAKKVIENGFRIAEIHQTFDL
jgi:pyrroloquinoline quinone biosynthesis protein B